MNIRNIVSIMLCCSRVLPIQSFNRIQTRRFVRTSVLIRSKKKTPVAVSSYAVNASPLQRNKKMSPRYEPRTDNQKSYVDNLQDWNVPIVLGIGPAGCGKTMFACLQAIQELKSGSVDKIILTRPIVPVEEEELGFLPGNLVKKMDPWTRPVFDIFSEFYQQRDIENMIHCGIFEISPLAYMRGRTFKRAFIIADEMQNSTPNQMLMLTTRIGDYSKMVITGDLKQSDRSADNGLLDFMDKLNFHKQRKDYVEGPLRIEMTQMEKGDVQRSPIVSQILDIYNKTVDGYEAVIHVDDYEENTKMKFVHSFNYTNDTAFIPLRDLPTKHFNMKDWLI